MSYYLERDSHIREITGTVKLCYQERIRTCYIATGVDRSDLASKKDFNILKIEVDINKFTNVTTGLSYMKTNIEDLDVGKLETVPIDLKKLNDIVSKEVVKKIVYGTTNMKVNNLEKKFADVSNLIQINQ